MAEKLIKFANNHANRLEWLMIFGLTYFFFALGEGSLFFLNSVAISLTNLIFTFLVVFTSRKLFFLLVQHFIRPLPQSVKHQFLQGLLIVIILAVFVTFLNWLYIHVYWQEHLLETRFFDLILPCGLITFAAWIIKDIWAYKLKNLTPRLETDNTNRNHVLVVRKGKKSIVIEPKEIAYFLVEDHLTYLFTFDGRQFVLSKSLSQIEEEVSSSIFFRINRQMIVNKKYISSFKNEVNEKLSLSFLSDKAEKLPNKVSRYKASAFRSWIKP